MKKLSLLCLLIVVFMNAQSVELVNGDYMYTKIINTSKKKKDIYPMLKKWLTDNSLQYFIRTDDRDLGILSFDERLSLMHYNDTQSTFPSFNSTFEIQNRKVIYKAGHIVLQDNYGGMTNIKNDYKSLLDRITNLTLHINELKDQLTTERDEKRRSDIRKEIDIENKKLNQSNAVKIKLTDCFARNVDMIIKMLNQN
ncbi:hypothetical protein SAMN06265171_105182 [Chryseobacterium rhizoplanae]|uniref:DUF4468 domain-containing protein n=1 Tax=Chryseobacterium rhizoplanae TaxID=1609531 RepID=A0A521DJJ0_9FLAO|nr:hypothetical protein [Chryseobacterium rhizoplanae]SMO71914.1 hypothetical protein SAMN06265171_105182 [Chryseobacterium rhizoplanae]